LNKFCNSDCSQPFIDASTLEALIDFKGSPVLAGSKSGQIAEQTAHHTEQLVPQLKYNTSIINYSHYSIASIIQNSKPENSKELSVTVFHKHIKLPISVKSNLLYND